MAYLVNLKGAEKSNAKRDIRTSSSGRHISIPDKFLTSEDDTPPTAKSKYGATVKAELKFQAASPTINSVLKLAVERAQAKTAEKNSSLNWKENSLPARRINQIEASPSLINSAVKVATVLEQTKTADTSSTPCLKEVALPTNENDRLQMPPSSVLDQVGCPIDTSIFDIDRLFADLQIVKEQNLRILCKHDVLTPKVDNILKILEEQHKEATSNEKLYGPIEGFPLKTVQEFVELDSDTEESNRKRQKLLRHLLTLGGAKLRDFLSSALKQVLTDEAVTHFTWHGAGKIPKFGDTRVSNVIYTSAVKCPYFKGPDSILQYKTKMREVMRITKQRYRNSVKDQKTEDKYENLSYPELMQKIRLIEDEIQGRDNFEEEELADISEFDEEEEVGMENQIL